MGLGGLGVEIAGELQAILVTCIVQKSSHSKICSAEDMRKSLLASQWQLIAFVLCCPTADGEKIVTYLCVSLRVNAGLC